MRWSKKQKYLKKVKEFFPDPVLEKIAKSYYLTKRKIERRRYKDRIILGGEEGNSLIASIIKENQPSAIGKIGVAELRAVRIYDGLYMPENESIKWQPLKFDGRYIGGIFPDTDEILERFSKYYTEVLRQMDVIGVWFKKDESKVTEKYAPDATLIETKPLQGPFFFQNPWSKDLEGKKVLAVHPFVETIKHQYPKREDIWSHNPDILPEMELDTLRVPQNAALVESEFSDWFETLEHLKKEMDKKDFDVAIIGAGAWSLPLAVHAKSLGKIGIHMGGASQLLFGIKGGRWNRPSSPVYPFFNDAWTFVLPGELPDESKIAQVPEKDRYW